MIPENTPPNTKVIHHKFGIVTILNISGECVEARFGEQGSTLMTYRKFLTPTEK